jgi:hypothetical protein
VVPLAQPAVKVINTSVSVKKIPNFLMYLPFSILVAYFDYCLLSVSFAALLFCQT